MIAVLGAGSHGRQVAHDHGTILLFDDRLDGYEKCSEGAQKYRWIAGPMWPGVRRALVDLLWEPKDPWNRGIYVSPKATIGIEVTFGDHVHVLAGATVSHGCVLGDYVTVATGAILCGEVTVEEGAFIGAGATVIHGGITIGYGAHIGAGAIVEHDIPAGMKVRAPKSVVS